MPISRSLRLPHLSLIDDVQTRIRESLSEDPFQRDPEYIASVIPRFEKILSWFKSSVRGFERLPPKDAYLIVGNHSGGMYTPDAYILLAAWYRALGVDYPFYAMAHGLLFATPLGERFRKLGCLPACNENAERALDRREPVLIYPGGDHEAFRPWTQRNRIDFGGRMGFIRLALRKQVPVVPVVAHGSHDSTIVLSRGDALARRLEFYRARVKVMPLILSVPWGVVPGFVPHLPLPARIWIEFCDPISWPELEPDTANDPEIVRRCFSQVVEAMQAKLDDLVEHDPFPVLPIEPERIKDWRRRRSRPAHQQAQRFTPEPSPPHPY